MATVKSTDILGNIDQYRYNPTLIHRSSLELLKQLYDGNIDIVDPSNPFVFCLENTAYNAASFMQQNEASTRRLYPIAALTQEDLYLHMSDKEYIDRFAKPTSATFKVLYDKEELLAAMVFDQDEAVHKVTIPRNSVFLVNDLPFSIQYPIDIRRLPHGGIQVIYDTTETSPLQMLETNVIEWRQMSNPQKQTFIEFEVVADQFEIVTYYNDITAASGLVTSITLDDSFYFVRVFNYVNNKYVELKTTHTEQIYDPNTPTAVVKVYDDRIDVAIPPIYASNGLVSGKLRIDVYQTKGRLTRSFSNLTLKDFSLQYKGIDPKDENQFSAPLNTLRTSIVYSLSNIDGGRAALAFEELKKRVINNSTGVKNLPITNVQLESAILDNNYDLVKNVDTITNRIFLASRFINRPTDEKILTAAGTAMVTANTSLRRLKEVYGIKDNLVSFTLTPSSIFKEVNGTCYPITNGEYAGISILPTAAKIAEISDNNYYYTPFYYVLDNSRERFDVRAYNLDDTLVDKKTFIAENITTGIQVSIDNITLDKTNDGYLLGLSTTSSLGFQELPDSAIAVQLSYFPKDTAKRAYLNGRYISSSPTTKERYYVFEIKTNLDIDKENFIDMKSFNIDLTGFELKAELEQTFDLFFIVDKAQVVSSTLTTIDDKISNEDLPFDGIGLTHERFNLVFGRHLKNLWQRHKTITEQTPYEVYLDNIPAYYEEDVYEIDPLTGAAFTIDSNGNLIYNKIHSKGDPILNATGEPVYKHYKGEVKVDSYGDPITPLGYTKDLVRLCDVLMIDAVYQFSTDPLVKTYQGQVRKSLSNWILTEIDQFNRRALEQTRVFFYPKNTIAKISVLDNQNKIISLDAAQTLKVKLYVPPVTYDDPALVESLIKTTIKTIDQELQASVISTSSIHVALRNVYKADVVDVVVAGVGGSITADTFTLVSKTDRCSIKKRLVALADNTLIVQEAIDIEVIKHGID